MNKVYALTDLHGQYELWEQIKEYIDETDIIYFLGDAIDRGPKGFTTMKELLAMDNVIYLKGNHEEFFVNEALKCKRKGGISILWQYNGGSSTADEIVFGKETEEELKKIIFEIDNLPEVINFENKYGQNIILSHAGFDPSFINASDFNPMWDRTHFLADWVLEDNEFMVHGHTPACNLLAKIGEGEVFYSKFDTFEEYENLQKKWENTVKKWFENPVVCNYCDGHKFDLDLGSFDTKKIALFDLDELKVAKYFTAKGENNE